MTYKKQLRGVAQYVKGTSREAEVAQASPYRLIQILMEALLGRLAATKGAIETGDGLSKTQSSTRAQAIITELRTSLDFEKGKEVAITLNSLYDYMGRRLVQATAANDASMVQEVINLMKPVKEGWDAIKAEAEKVLEERRSE
ncbi:flagellar export chaperone FliS [Marinospirillum alkaliphilum]|uniref:Flagellar secretion chaperone FliS n=1 Tax=Marinospirillum alkaliphilum DSM 21637 TaxID=1122209 RepID=A0A1K1VI36_9GAMM|nr:flagellar export chaperone FliS [Marinospirillum alkaliphilum]SFX24832.1 flagellar protein FliS [Marinospirillum alkaliphilum DSM 21637]